MLLTPAGEDSIVLCPECGYSANMEAAECIYHTEDNGTDRSADAANIGSGNASADESGPLLPVETPRRTHIEELADFLHIAPSLHLQGRRLSEKSG